MQRDNRGVDQETAVAATALRIAKQYKDWTQDNPAAACVLDVRDYGHRHYVTDEVKEYYSEHFAEEYGQLSDLEGEQADGGVGSDDPEGLPGQQGHPAAAMGLWMTVMSQAQTPQMKTKIAVKGSPLGRTVAVMGGMRMRKKLRVTMMVMVMVMMMMVMITDMAVWWSMID